MKRIATAVFMLALCAALPAAALATTDTADSAEALEAPYAQNLETGEILYLGMDRAEAEAIVGEPLGRDEIRPGRFVFGNGLRVCDGITVAFREDRLVFVEIPYEDEYFAGDELIPDAPPKWAALGVAAPFMPLDAAVEALGMTYNETSLRYHLTYFENGARAQYDESLGDKGGEPYVWEIVLYGGSDRILGSIWMGDQRYFTTFS